MKWWDQMPWSLFFKCWVLSQLFHSPLWPSSRGSLVPLHFLPLERYHLHIWGCWYFSWQSWFQLVIHSTWHFAWCTLIEVSKQADSIQPLHAPSFEPVHCSTSGSNWELEEAHCSFKEAASWKALSTRGLCFLVTSKQTFPGLLKQCKSTLL